AFCRWLCCLTSHGYLGRSRALVAEGIASRIGDGVDAASSHSGALCPQEERAHVRPERDWSAAHRLDVVRLISISQALVWLIAGNRHERDRRIRIATVVFIDCCIDL